MANDRDCENCKHRKKEVCKDGIFYYSCDLWDCEFEPYEPVRNPDQLDCVSRQAAIDTIESWLSCDDYNEAERHIMRAMQSVLYDLPSVNPQKPCEPVRNPDKLDCINRQAVIDACDQSINLFEAVERIKELPSVSSSENPNINEVLGKIRAEIDEQYDRVRPYDISCAEGLEMALDIIDKYKAEGSGEE